MENKNKTQSLIIHVGLSGFPNGKAAIQRILTICKAIKISGKFKSIVVSKFSVHSKIDVDKFNIKKVSSFQGIDYIYTSPTIYRNDRFIKRNFEKILGLRNEYLYIFRNRKSIAFLSFYDESFISLLYYKIICLCFDIKLLVHYVEFRSSIKERQKFLTLINDKLFDNNLAKIADAVIVISDFLQNHLKAINVKLPILKVPSITDYSIFEQDNIKFRITNNSYFLYCASAEYYDIFIFIIESFEKFKILSNNDFELVLILGGDESKIERVIQRIKKSPNQNSIILKSNLAFSELVDTYKGAWSLLIPLDNTVQDIARFPHKISEYCASKSPIITTNIGEVQTYFIDEFNAFVASDFSIENFALKILEASNSSEIAKKIGYKGYETGVENFSYTAYSEKIIKFLDELI